MVNLKDISKLHRKMAEKAVQLLERKNQDYGVGTDPFHNFRRHGVYGILVRINDKLARLESFNTKGYNAVEEESIEDTCIDLINYTILLYAYLIDTGQLENKYEDRSLEDLEQYGLWQQPKKS